MGKQAASQTQSLWSKYTAASLCDPLPASMGGGAQSQLDALVAKNFADGDIICLALSAGGSVRAALKRKKRLARCEEKSCGTLRSAGVLFLLPVTMMQQ